MTLGPVTVLAIALHVGLSTLAQTDDEKKAAEPAKESPKAEASAAQQAPAMAERPAGVVGSILAVVPEADTLVVNMPLGNRVVTVGGWMTPKTKIIREGRAVKLDSLEAGGRGRVTFHSIPTGDNFSMVEVLK
jgi:hypothetical protein